MFGQRPADFGHDLIISNRPNVDSNFLNEITHNGVTTMISKVMVNIGSVKNYHRTSNISRTKPQN